MRRSLRAAADEHAEAIGAGQAYLFDPDRR